MTLGEIGQLSLAEEAEFRKLSLDSLAKKCTAIPLNYLYDAIKNSLSQCHNSYHSH